MPSDPVIASLDLGSNTFRLMLAQKSGLSWRDKKVFQHIPRLSENLRDGGAFAPEALMRAWEAVADFDAKIKAAGAVKVLAGATMAARIASDGPDFMAALARRYGWETRILKGEEEGRATALGVLSGLEPVPKETLMFDIGGRSTEFVSLHGRELVKSRSLAVGVVGLTEAFPGDPTPPSAISGMSESIRKILAAADFTDVGLAPTLVGTAGTVTTIAALLLKLGEYDPDRVNNARVGQADVAALLEALSKISVADRVALYKLPARRADAMPAGLLLVLEVMAKFGREEIIVSDNGLLEGLWLSAAGLSA